MTLEELSDHESAHLVMALTLDVPVKHASVIPDGISGGRVLISPEGMTAHDYDVKSALVLLAGPIESDECVDYRPTLSTTATRGDMHDLAHITEHITDEQYQQLLETATGLMLTRTFQRRKAVFSHLLERHHYLSADDVNLILRHIEGTDTP
jgi:hypothetical protein